MSVKLPIVVARNGTICVIRYSDDISLFSSQLRDPKNCLISCLAPKAYLVAVSSADINLVSQFMLGPFESSFDKNSFFIPGELLPDEQAILDHIINVLTIDGVIGGSGIHQKSVKSGTYVNFPFGSNRDCEIVKLFMGF